MSSVNSIVPEVACLKMMSSVHVMFCLIHQTQIARVLRQAAHVTKAAYNLTKGHGLLTWIVQVVERR